MNQESSQVWKEFEENTVSHSAAHYLLAIDELHRDNGYARSVDIARELDITAGSCSSWLKWLLKKWLIEEDKNKFISLSEQEKISLKKSKKIENYLYNFLQKYLEQMIRNPLLQLVRLNI